MAIKILPNMMSGSTIYTTTTNVVAQQYVNPYTSTCNGGAACASYGALTKCPIDIYQGVRACQTIYLIDADGNLIDTDRLDNVSVTIQNSFGCKVYWFSTQELEDYNPIEFLQTKYDGEMLRIDANNFNEVMFGDDTPMFDVDENSIYLEDGKIRVVSDGCSTPFITTPLEYTDKITVNMAVSDMDDGMKLVMRANGSPNILEPNGETELIMLTESSDGCILDFSVNGTGGFTLDGLQLTTVGGIDNKGAIRICFEDYETQDMVPSVLTAIVTYKFKDDDPTEHGATHIVKCVQIGTIHKNETLNTDDETPIISHLVRPEHIVYDNSESGLESTNMADATLEVKYMIENFHNDKHYEADCVCARSEMRNMYYWLVNHNLGLLVTKQADGTNKGVGVSVTLEDTDGNDIYGEIEYINENTLLVWFTECVDGRIIIN